MKKAIGYVVSAVALSSAFGIIQAGPALAAETVDRGLIENAAKSIDGQESQQDHALNETRMVPISGWHQNEMHAPSMSLHQNTGMAGYMSFGADTANTKKSAPPPKLNIGDVKKSAPSSGDAGSDHALSGSDTYDFIRSDLQASIMREAAAQAAADAAAAAAAAQSNPPPGGGGGGGGSTSVGNANSAGAGVSD